MEFTKQQEALQKAVMTAWEDATFKNELLANPVQAIEALTGVKFQIPAGKEFVILEGDTKADYSDNSKIYYSFPSKESVFEVELSEEQLENVAGGAKVPTLGTIIIESCFCMPVSINCFETM